jgi:hypothetical protein
MEAIKKKLGEVDVAAFVVEWLKSGGWTVYQEVSIGYADRRADIVANRGSIWWIVEVKATFSLELINQAMRWQGFAHMVSVATPTGSRSRHSWNEFKSWIFEQLGIGYVQVEDAEFVNQIKRPIFRRRISSTLINKIRPEHQSFAPAGSQGGYFSPFKGTVNEAVRFVTKHPGCTIKELVAGIPHHYANDRSARCCLLKGILEGLVPIETKHGAGGAYQLFPKDEREDQVRGVR